MSTGPAKSVAKALGGRKAGGAWIACCPAHEDRAFLLSLHVPLIKAFGAPIAPADAKTIGDYLKQNYGG